MTTSLQDVQFLLQGTLNSRVCKVPEEHSYYNWPGYHLWYIIESRVLRRRNCICTEDWWTFGQEMLRIVFSDRDLDSFALYISLFPLWPSAFWCNSCSLFLRDWMVDELTGLPALADWSASSLSPRSSTCHQPQLAESCISPLISQCISGRSQ